MPTCPAGHESASTDYCDTCGVPIGAARAVPVAPASSARPCPGCGDSVEGRFCESCGYDVELGKAAAPTPVVLALSADKAHWDRVVGSGEPAFPTEPPTLTLELVGDKASLGRVKPGAAPDVDLPLTGSAADPAVSHHQCEFERDGATWVVRDAGSANGTYINDATEPLAAGETHRLVDGDRILIGAWTCLTVQSKAPAAPAAPPAPPCCPARGRSGGPHRAVHGRRHGRFRGRRGRRARRSCRRVRVGWCPGPGGPGALCRLAVGQRRRRAPAHRLVRRRGREPRDRAAPSRTGRGPRPRRDARARGRRGAGSVVGGNRAGRV